MTNILQYNLQSPSETEEIRINLCSDRQNQFQSSNTNQGLQTVSIRPPVKGSRPRSLPEGDRPV